MPNENPDWLVMVYISADGLLANFAVESLKQLKRAAGNGIKVVAQFDTDGIIRAKRYIFEKFEDLSPLADSDTEPPEVQPKVGTPDPEDLKSFIDAALQKSPQAKHHALFLWGHGPELLSDEDPKSLPEGKRKAKHSDKPTYLTVSQLRKALSETQLATGELKKKIDILGLDACSMSMAELASELGDYVQFMVASQEDVPDMSFPYETILPLLRKMDSAEEASKMISEVYGKSYSDYIANPRTGVRAITMSAIALDKNRMDSITTPLTTLAGLLLDLSKSEDARGKILTAREQSRGFVFGLFVDIVDLCQQLRDSNISNDELKKTCTDIQKVIGNRNEVVIAKTAETGDGAPRDGKVAAGGLSIYFPYRIPDDTEDLQEVRVKGSRDHPTKERIQRIHQLERDFADLKDAWVKTGWTKFIKEGWSSILANEAKPRNLVLDEIYSAQQCAQNLGSVRQEARVDRQAPVPDYPKPPKRERSGSCDQPPAVSQ
jgi:hypothetical protein